MIPADVSRRLAVALDVGNPSVEMRMQIAESGTASDSWENLPENVKRFVLETERK